MEQKKIIFVKLNGKTGSKGWKIEIAESANRLDIVREALKEEHSLKHIDHSRFFNPQGSEITDDTLILIKENETIFLENEPGKAFDYENILEQYKILEPLGEGGFGKVLKAKHKGTGNLSAIKYIDISDISKEY